MEFNSFPVDIQLWAWMKMILHYFSTYWKQSSIYSSSIKVGSFWPISFREVRLLLKIYGSNLISNCKFEFLVSATISNLKTLNISIMFIQTSVFCIYYPDLSQLITNWILNQQIKMIWQLAIKFIRPRHNTLYTNYRNCENSANISISIDSW